MTIKLERKDSVMNLAEGNKNKVYSNLEMQSNCKSSYDEGIITGREQGWKEAVDFIINMYKEKYNEDDIKKLWEE
jgi:hypothetical protein